MIQIQHPCHQAVFINCMLLKSSLAVYREVAAQLLGPQGAAVRTEKEALRAIERTVTAKGPMILLGTYTGIVLYGELIFEVHSQNFTSI